MNEELTITTKTFVWIASLKASDNLHLILWSRHESNRWTKSWQFNMLNGFDTPDCSTVHTTAPLPSQLFRKGCSQVSNLDALYPYRAGRQAQLRCLGRHELLPIHQNARNARCGAAEFLRQTFWFNSNRQKHVCECELTDMSGEQPRRHAL